MTESQRFGVEVVDVDFPDEIDQIRFGDWVRIWLGVRPSGMSRRLWRQIDEKILDTSVRSMWLISTLSILSFFILSAIMVPLSRPSGQRWFVHGLVTWTLFGISVLMVERLRRRGALNRTRYFLTIAPFVFSGSLLWGLLPLAVGSEDLHRFYLAVGVCAAAIMIAYFATLGLWVLSVLSCVTMTAATVYSYTQGGGPDPWLVAVLCIILLLGLSFVSFGGTVALVRARYETVVAADRKETIQMLMSDYEEGGHDWFWEADDELRLANIPPKMLLAAHGDPRIRNGQPLRALLADHPTAMDNLVHRRPFQVDVVVEGPDGDGELRLWARPDTTLGHGSYRGVGSDLGAERRAVARDMESARLEAMIALTGGITHDFNNQLATILGSVELAEFTAEDANSSRVHLGRALDACLRSRRMIADLSAALGIGAPPESSPFDVAESLDEVIAEVNLHYPQMTIVRAGGKNVWAFADRGHYERAVRNLVENACHANERNPTTSGNVTLSIEVGVSLVGGPVVQLLVSDDGPGVPEHERTQVFEPFFTTWSDEGRAGLGLAVAKGFARQANGRLSIEDTARGAVFRLEVPRALMESEVEEPKEPASIAELVHSEALDGTFLVIEDDRNVATTIRKFLEAFGATVESAETVAQGIERVTSGADYRCVVSDLVLPDGEGYEVIEELRRRKPNAPVVYVSGFSRKLPSAVSPHLRAPLVPKPFSSTELFAALRMVGVTHHASGNERSRPDFD